MSNETEQTQQNEPTDIDTSHTNEGSTPDGQAARKLKRHAGDDFQQSKDDDSDDEDMPTGTGEFEKADESVLKQRR